MSFGIDKAWADRFESKSNLTLFSWGATKSFEVSVSPNTTFWIASCPHTQKTQQQSSSKTSTMSAPVKPAEATVAVAEWTVSLVNATSWTSPPSSAVAVLVFLAPDASATTWEDRACAKFSRLFVLRACVWICCSSDTRGISPPCSPKSSLKMPRCCRSDTPSACWILRLVLQRSPISAAPTETPEERQPTTPQKRSFDMEF
mmetsp:Transcript_73886/g.205432  ORF Transcript_73886/g.205432 Transcript_73886/m.205432 type:complete len:202 (-) Transcript_73886:84-689(-)